MNTSVWKGESLSGDRTRHFNVRIGEGENLRGSGRGWLAILLLGALYYDRPP